MANTYNKPETKVIKVEAQQIMAGTTQDISNETPHEWAAKENTFVFFEEEEMPSDDDDSWEEEWEDEIYP